MNLRTSFRKTPIVLLLGVLAGCGSSFQGTLNTGGNGSGPTPPAGSPSITSLSPSTVVAGGPSFTLTVKGLNFKSNETVEWDSTALTTTYVSSKEMQAQVPASAIARPSGVIVIVATSPPSSMNFGALFTITVPPLSGNGSYSVSTVAIQANDMVWDPISQQLYLSVPSGNGANSDSITALNPVNGQLGISQNMGSAPDRLALANDGSYLYAGTDGSGSVQRFKLPSLEPDISIPLGTYAAYQNAPYYAMDVEVAPGNPNAVAVVRGVSQISPRDQGGVTIYDDAVARPVSVPGESAGNIAIDTMTWNPDGVTIYGIYSGGSANLYELSVDSDGVQVAHDFSSQTGIYGNHALQYVAATGYIYSSTGQVIDPTTGAVVGTFPTDTIQGGLSLSVMVADEALNIAYFLGQTEESGVYQEYALEAFDLTHFTLLGAIPISNVVGQPVKMLRWGTNGLAVLTNTGDHEVYLISGAFVTSPAAQSKGGSGSFLTRVNPALP